MRKVLKDEMELKEQWFTFEGVGTITMEDVYQLIKKHSRLIDRINPRKMIKMTFDAFDILNKSIKEPNDETWKFFSKNSIYDTEYWKT